MKVHHNLRALAVFEIFSRVKNYTEAGKCLNVTHSAVSQQIRNLERNLGVKLVVKNNGVVSLTQAGQELADGLRLGFQQLNSSVRKTLGRSEKETITVTMTPSFATEWMSPNIAKFKNAFPFIDLVISPCFDLVDMKTNNIDMGIRFGDGSWEGIGVNPWRKTPFVVVTATKTLSATDNLLDFDITSLPWLQELGTTEVEDWAKGSGHPLENNPKLLFLPGHMILPAMREGCGIACTAKMLVEEDINNGYVTVLHTFPGDDHRLGYYLVTPNKTTEPTIQNIIDWFDLQR